MKDQTKTVLDDLIELFSPLDYSTTDQHAAEKHINNIESFAKQSHKAIAIYDNKVNKPIYMSEAYRDYFGDDIDTVHPDDFDAVYQSSIDTLLYFKNNNIESQIPMHRLVRKYRAKINNKYVVVIEHVEPIEFDAQGNVWLSRITIDISPIQTPPYNVDFKIINIKTGDIITLDYSSHKNRQLLSKREIEILRLINKGLLSKEISDQLNISVHTVNTHRQRILEKLQANSSIEAIKAASNKGIIL
ncbi:MAG TPA: hypothetical protein DCF91_06115 [Porphyromonadaceae bacterium]|nr:hypothetical protein [Porphyromonadaceae bacterium]